MDGSRPMCDWSKCVGSTIATWHDDADIDIAALIIVLSIQLKPKVIIDVEQDVIVIIV